MSVASLATLAVTRASAGPRHMVAPARSRSRCSMRWKWYAIVVLVRQASGDGTARPSRCSLRTEGRKRRRRAREGGRGGPPDLPAGDFFCRATARRGARTPVHCTNASDMAAEKPRRRRASSRRRRSSSRSRKRRREAEICQKKRRLRGPQAAAPVAVSLLWGPVQRRRAHASASACMHLPSPPAWPPRVACLRRPSHGRFLRTAAGLGTRGGAGGMRVARQLLTALNKPPGGPQPLPA